MDTWALNAKSFWMRLDNSEQVRREVAERPQLLLVGKVNSIKSRWFQTAWQ